MVQRSGNVSRGTATGCILSLLLAFGLRMRRCQMTLKDTTWKAQWLHFNRLMTLILRLASRTGALWENVFYPSPMHAHSKSLLAAPTQVISQGERNPKKKRNWDKVDNSFKLHFKVGKGLKIVQPSQYLETRLFQFVRPWIGYRCKHFTSCLSLIFAAERYQITESCVRVRKTYKSRQVETKQKNNRKITLRSSRIRILVLIFSGEGRRYKITSKLKVACFVSSVFTKANCICVISKALNGVKIFKTVPLQRFLSSVKRILVSYLQPASTFWNVHSRANFHLHFR